MIVYILRKPGSAPRLYGSLSEAQSKCGERLKWNKTGVNGWYAVSRRHARFYINSAVVPRKMPNHLVLAPGSVGKIEVITDGKTRTSVYTVKAVDGCLQIKFE